LSDHHPNISFGQYCDASARSAIVRANKLSNTTATSSATGKIAGFPGAKAALSAWEKGKQDGSFIMWNN
jgi:hypothetical protein